MKRILFDENVPRQLRRDLPEFTVRTVQEERWAGLENGSLLRRASGHFDILLTADQRLRYQQNVAQFDIAVVVIKTYDTRMRNLRRLLPAIKAALQSTVKGEVTLIIDPPAD